MEINRSTLWLLILSISVIQWSILSILIVKYRKHRNGPSLVGWLVFLFHLVHHYSHELIKGKLCSINISITLYFLYWYQLINLYVTKGYSGVLQVKKQLEVYSMLTNISKVKSGWTSFQFAYQGWSKLFVSVELSDAFVQVLH